MYNQHRWQLGYIQLFDGISFRLTVGTVPAVNFLATEVHVHALIQIAQICICRQLQAEIRKTLVCGRLLGAGHTLDGALDLTIK